MTPIRRTLLTLSVLLLACADPFAAAQDADNIETYEQFLSENPTSRYRTQAEGRLEELLLDAARAQADLAGFDAYLERFPKGALHEKAIAERRAHLFDWADETDTSEAWEKYLAEYPTGDRKRKKTAKKRMRMCRYRDQIALGPVEMTQINLAGKDDGPLDGWGFYVDVTSNVAAPVERLQLRISFLGSAGEVLDVSDWPVVAPGRLGAFAGPAEVYEPMKKGETRQWFFDTGDVPAGWAKKVSVRAVDIHFEGIEG